MTTVPIGTARAERLPCLPTSHPTSPRVCVSPEAKLGGAERLLQGLQRALVSSMMVNGSAAKGTVQHVKLRTREQVDWWVARSQQGELSVAIGERDEFIGCTGLFGADSRCFFQKEVLHGQQRLDAGNHSEVIFGGGLESAL